MTDKYIEQANVTMSDSWHGEKVIRQELVQVLNGSISNLERLDKIKKAMFYGRDFDALKTQGSDLSGLPSSGLLPGGTLSDNIRLIHGIIGIATEAGELLEALANAMESGAPIDGVNLVEEIGDVFWYSAAILRVLGVSFEDAQAINIGKLRARFPNGFQEFDANNRDLTTERKILESGAQ